MNSYEAYQVAQIFENEGKEVWFRDNEDHIVWMEQNGVHVSVELCQKKFEDDVWGFELRIYAQDNGHLPIFKERMSNKNDAKFYYDMINMKINKYFEK